MFEFKMKIIKLKKKINNKQEENINCFFYNFSNILTLYFLQNILRETEAELTKKVESYQEMNYEKHSFIGKLDKIESDFNTYQEQMEAMKNIEIDLNQLHTPEFYLQTIINRKRPETAVPCNQRTINKNSSFDESEIKIKQSRIKTSINKRDSLNRRCGDVKSASFEERNLTANAKKPSNKHLGNKNIEAKKFNIGGFENMFDFDPDFLENNILQNEISGEPINIDNVNEESAFPNRPQAFTTALSGRNVNFNSNKAKLSESGSAGFNNFRIKNASVIRSKFIFYLFISLFI